MQFVAKHTGSPLSESEIAEWQFYYDNVSHPDRPRDNKIYNNGDDLLQELHVEK